jgi:ABC-type transport system involved in multi-copper enzyme maturation permease subunit
VSAASQTPAPTAHAAVHDLGYERYTGARRAQSTRYRVLVKNLLTMSWRGWWRMRLWFLAAVIAVMVAGALLYAAVYLKQFTPVGGMARSGTPLSFLDAILPVTIDAAFAKLGFLLGLTALAPVIAKDLRAGAFEFYFSRPVRPRDYVLGRVLGACLVMGVVVFAGPLLLALVRVGLSSGQGELTQALPIVYQTLAAGAVATIAYALLPLAFGALSTKPGHTIAIWATFYLVIGNVAFGIAHATDVRALAAVSVKESVMALVYAIYEVDITQELLPPVWAAGTALAVYVAAALAFLSWRVGRAERAGLGGG